MTVISDKRWQSFIKDTYGIDNSHFEKMAMNKVLNSELETLTKSSDQKIARAARQMTIARRTGKLGGPRGPLYMEWFDDDKPRRKLP